MAEEFLFAVPANRFTANSRIAALRTSELVGTAGVPICFSSAWRRPSACVILVTTMAPGRTTIGLLATYTALLLADGADARVTARPLWQLASSPSGEVSVVAREVPITQALEALARQAGFEVMADEGIERPPVNLTMPMGPAEHVLREILRGRNYAVVYDGATASLSQVILLAPSTASRSPVPARKPTAKKARAAVVIRN